jgi:hypothetical protein
VLLRFLVARCFSPGPFVPVIERNGGGHILNGHSVLSWLALGGSCSASDLRRWGGWDSNPTADGL